MREYTDQYRIQKADPTEAPELYRLMRTVWERLENKDLFAVEGMDLEWFRKFLDPRRGFCVTARSETGELAGILMVCRPMEDDDNLGLDVGMTSEQRLRVVHMETAAVLPEHRGHDLERRMLAFAEEKLQGTDTRYLMATISPFNPPSLRAAERLGYQVLLTKEKYGGHLRHILIKGINGGSPDDLSCAEGRKLV